jgi:tetratricopeptide (TPR) repeat protein
MTGGPAAVAALAPLATFAPTASAGAQAAATAPGGRIGEVEAAALEAAVRTIRLLDDRHGADGIYRQAGASLRFAQELLDAGAGRRQSISDRLHSGAGELAISVGWLAHDSGRFTDARSHYAEALATARMNGDAALEAHASCNSAFLARDAGRPREAVRAAQAGQQAARQLSSYRLRSLLALREAGGWAGLGDRRGSQAALGRARDLFDRGPSGDDPEWMTFFGEAELAGLEAQCWSALRDYAPAADAARRAVDLQNPHFVRNTALFCAELADNLAAGGRPEEAAVTGMRSLRLLGQVSSTRISGMLQKTAERLRRHDGEPEVAVFRMAAG